MQGVRLQSPNIPPVRDYIDLCDGVSLAYLISYYCPNIVPWTSVRLNYMPTVEDSISNILLVSNFSQKHLPYSVFHMTPQDVTYMRGWVPEHMIVLLYCRDWTNSLIVKRPFFLQIDETKSSCSFSWFIQFIRNPSSQMCCVSRHGSTNIK